MTAHTKRGGGYDLEFAATIIVEAMLLGSDKLASDKHGVSERSLRRWRGNLTSDPKLAELVRAKRAVAERDWAEDLPGAIRAAIAFLQRAPAKLDPADPEAVRAAAGAMKLLTEVAMSRRIIDARLSRQAGPAGTPVGPGAPASTGDSPGSTPDPVH